MNDLSLPVKLKKLRRLLKGQIYVQRVLSNIKKVYRERLTFAAWRQKGLRGLKRDIDRNFNNSLRTVVSNRLKLS